MQIKSFKLRERMFGDYSYEVTNEETNIIDKFDRQCNSPVHPDLLKKMVELKPHVAVIMGWQVGLLKHDAAALDDIKIVAVDFENRGSVTIKFRFALPQIGYQTGITIPKIDFALDANNYKHMKKFKSAVDHFYDKVEAYHNGEYGEAEQLDLFNKGADNKEENAANKSEKGNPGADI